MRKHLRLVALLIPMVLVASNSYAAVKAGSACSKMGSKSVSGGKSYTCVKSGKKLVWDKGVLVPVAKPSVANPSPTPSASASASPIAAKVAEGDSCEKLGVQVKSSGNLFECRRIVGNKLVYIGISNNFVSVVNPASPDSLATCQLPDMRANKLWIRPGIAYPPTPFPGFSSTGTFKVIVVGFDFSDAVGSGSPSA